MAGAAHGAGPGLPEPFFTHAGYVPVVAASGATVALATSEQSGCAIRLFRPAASRSFVTVKTTELCPEDSDAFIDRLWLGRSTVGAELLESPSPHGDAFTYVLGPRSGPLREQGAWSWTDSDPPYGFGCRWSVAAGGGAIAAAAGPHRLGYDHGLDQDTPACPIRDHTEVRLTAASGVEAKGVWSPLATDGKRILLAGQDENGDRTGELKLIDATGANLAAPVVDPVTAKRAVRAWLAPEGFVYETPAGIVGPGWTVKQDGDVTVAEGRVLYVSRRALHVRRIRGGADRTLLTLPRGDSASLAAGSFGLAVAVLHETDSSASVRLYRLPWRTIDKTLTAR